MLFHAGSVVFFIFSQCHGLRCARFAATEVARPGKHAGRRAMLCDPNHGFADDLNVLGLEPQILRRVGCNGLAGAAVGLLGGHDQLRFVFDAVVGHDGGGLRQLQHGKTVVALANAQRNGFAGIPFLLFWAFVVSAFPCLAGQDAWHLATNINACDLPKAQRCHEVVNGVHPQFIGQ